MLPGTGTIPLRVYIHTWLLLLFVLCKLFFIVFFYVVHIFVTFFSSSSLYSFLLPKTTHKKRRTNKASRVKVCSVRFRALWSSPRVPSLVLIQEERTEKRRRRTATRSSREEQEQEEKERWILRTIPTIGTMLPNARQLEIIMTIKELRKTEEKR